MTEVLSKTEIIEMMRQMEIRMKAVETKLEQFIREVRRNDFDSGFVGHEPIG